jgi:hypothetical protein
LRYASYMNLIFTEGITANTTISGQTKLTTVTSGTGTVTVY